MAELVAEDGPELTILARLAGRSFGLELFSAELFCAPYAHCLFCTRRIAEGSGGDFKTKGYVTLTAIEAPEAPLWLQWDWVCVACFGSYREKAKWTVLDRGLDAAAFGAFRKNRDESLRRMKDEDVCAVDRYALQVTWTPEEIVWIAQARGVALSEAEASQWLWRNRRRIAGRMEAVAYAYICERMEREIRADRAAGPDAPTPGSAFVDLWSRSLELPDAGAQQRYVGKHLEEVCRANELGYWRCPEPPPKLAGRCLFVGIAEWVWAEVVLLDRLAACRKARAAETPLIYVFGMAECQQIEEIKRFVPDIERRPGQSPLVAVWENGECQLTVGDYAALQWLERHLEGYVPMNINVVLVHNCFNEILHGLFLSSAVLQMLERKPEIETLFESWRIEPSHDLLFRNRSLIADVVEVVCSELGDEELHTRVGVDLDEARTFVKELRTEGHPH